MFCLVGGYVVFCFGLNWFADFLHFVTPTCVCWLVCCFCCTCGDLGFGFNFVVFDLVYVFDF